MHRDFLCYWNFSIIVAVVSVFEKEFPQSRFLKRNPQNTYLQKVQKFSKYLPLKRNPRNARSQKGFLKVSTSKEQSSEYLSAGKKLQERILGVPILKGNLQNTYQGITLYTLSSQVNSQSIYLQKEMPETRRNVHQFSFGTLPRQLEADFH